MKDRIVFYLSLLIFSSFIVGMPVHTLALEAAAANNLFSPAEQASDVIKLMLLIATHLGLFALIFIKQNGLSGFMIKFVPVAFLVAQFINGIIFYFTYPLMFLSLLPFIGAYILCVREYQRTKNELQLIA